MCVIYEEEEEVLETAPTLRSYAEIVPDVCEHVHGYGHTSTLLAIQQSSRVGWEAATPFLYKTYVFRNAEDHYRFTEWVFSYDSRRRERSVVAFNYVKTIDFQHWIPHDLFLRRLKLHKQLGQRRGGVDLILSSLKPVEYPLTYGLANLDRLRHAQYRSRPKRRGWCSRSLGWIRKSRRTIRTSITSVEKTSNTGYAPDEERTSIPGKLNSAPIFPNLAHVRVSKEAQQYLSSYDPKTVHIDLDEHGLDMLDLGRGSKAGRSTGGLDDWGTYWSEGIATVLLQLNMAAFTTSLATVTHLCFDHPPLRQIPRNPGEANNNANRALDCVGRWQAVEIGALLDLLRPTFNQKIEIHCHNVPSLFLTTLNWSGFSVHFHIASRLSEPDVPLALVELSTGICDQLGFSWPPYARALSALGSTVGPISWSLIGFEETLLEIGPSWLSMLDRFNLKIGDLVMAMARNAIPGRAEVGVAAAARARALAPSNGIQTDSRAADNLVSTTRQCEAFLQSEVDALKNDPQRLKYISRSEADHCPVCQRV